ncbi:MAG: alpha/beta fold hydrolase [Acidobacteriota bacterium]
MNSVLKNLAVLLVAVCLAAVLAAQDKAASFQSQEVKFDGHEVKLAGTLAVPKLEAGKRAPAVLIIGSEGKANRDGVLIGNVKQTIYRDMAEHLAARGMVVLRYDKRCAGESECKAAASFDDYVDDAKRGIEFLKKQTQVDAGKIFILGHSQGGYIAAIVGSHDDVKLAGVVLAAAPGRTLGKLLRDYVQVQMAEAGKKQDEISTYLLKFDYLIKELISGRQDFSGEKLNPGDPYEAVLLDLLKQREVTLSLLINDPLQVVNNIQSPVLILQGKKDLQVKVKDAEYLEEALKRASHKDITLKLFDDADHLLKTNKGAATLASYADTSRPLDPALLAAVTDWLQKKAK